MPEKLNPNKLQTAFTFKTWKFMKHRNDSKSLYEIFETRPDDRRPVFLQGKPDTG